MKKYVALAVVVMMLAMAFMGCAQSAGTETDTGAEASESASATEAPASSEEASAAATEDPSEATEGGREYKDFGEDGTYKVAFVCKFLTSVWFAPKNQAMQDRADELGIEYIGIDANSNEDNFMQGVQNAINQGVDGIILTPVNTSMLPAIVDLCKEAGVAYMTTDDGGEDADGNRVPHLGLDDYALGADAAAPMIAEAQARGFLDDPTKVKVVMIDVPAVESFHNRLVGGYDVVAAAAPDIPEENYVWVDSVDGLLDNVISKFSSQYQSLAAGTDYWIILGGDEGCPVGTYTILEENGVDFNNVLCSTICGSDAVPVIMDEDETKGKSIYFSGILPAPSGVALIDIMYDLFENGTPIPEFTGYPENVCDYSNYQENFAVYLNTEE